MIISYLSLVHTMPAGHCAHFSPILFCLERTLGRPSLRVLGRQPPAFFHLLLETHGRVAAKSPSHLLRARHPSRAGFLQHLRKTQAGPARFWSDGKAVVPKCYGPAPTPTLYVGQVSDVLGRVPLMPLLLHGNATPTIAPGLREHRSPAIRPRPYGSANAAQEPGRRASNVCEMNPLLF